MNSNFSLPDYRTIIYNLDSETGKYQREPEIVTFSKLPNTLKVEETWEEKIRNNGANYVITGPFKSKRREFFTGLIPVADQHWFMGNDYSTINGVKSNSLVVFNFSENKNRLTVYYFNNFYKFKREERISFVIWFIQRVNI